MARSILTLAAIFLLAACGDSDVKSVCFDNGEHGTMSDGRITRICDCRMKEAKVANLSAKDQQLLARIISDKSIGAPDKKRAQELTTAWANTAQVCAVAK